MRSTHADRNPLAVAAIGVIAATLAALLGSASFGASTAVAIGYDPGPLGVAVGPAGDVYLSDPRTNGQVQRFSSDGKLLDRWGHFGVPDTTFSVARDIAADAAGNVYVADTAHGRLGLFAANGTPIGRWPSASRAIAVAPAGDIYVIGYRREGRHARGFRVEKLTPDGILLAAWGPPGEELGEPWGIAVGPAGEVYVADTYSDRVVQFTGDGAFVTEFGGNGRSEGRLLRPYGVATGPAGNVYVADTANGRVQKFSPGGNLIAVLGSRGRRPGHFIDPMSVAVDGAGNIYVADHAASYLDAGGSARVQKFAPDGRFVTQWWSAPALPARPKLSGSVGRRTVKRNATFRFRSWQTDVRFKCRLLGRGVPRRLRRWRRCASAKRYRHLRPGRKVFWVKAVSGGEESGQAGRAWLIVERARDRRAGGGSRQPG